MTRPLKLAVVGAYPPSESSLTEYGHYFIGAMLENPDIEHVYAFSDDLPSGNYVDSEKLTARPTWQHNHIANAWRIRQAVVAAQPDAVIFNAQYATFGDRKIPAALGLLAPWIVRLSGVPTIVLLHNLVETIDLDEIGFGGGRLAKFIIRTGTSLVTRLILRANLVTVTIPKYAEILAEKYGADNVALVPHGSFEQSDEPSFDIPAGPPQILAFGKWGTYKRVDELIEAFRLLRAGGREIELVIAGSNNPNSPGYLEAIADENSDLTGLRFTGYVAEEDVAPLFRSAAMVVLPYTATTGSSGVLHQAGDYGQAAVLPRIGDFVELIEEEGFSGEYFEPANVQSMADAIARLLDDDEHRRHIALRNFRASQGLPISDIVDWFIIHIRTILGSSD